MSTVTLSKPHCAIISAEKPDGIASQAFTTALPEAQICLTLFGIDRVSLCRFLTRGPLDAHLADAELARSIHYRHPSLIRQGDAVLAALGAGLPFRIAGDQHLLDAGDRLGRANEREIAGYLLVEHVAGIDNIGVDVKRQHAIGEAPVRRGCSRAGQAAA